tara:strand:+ start:478 stop:1806 length:1329 start_codon:yes stop_codon:yes gene_type:complete
MLSFLSKNNIRSNFLNFLFILIPGSYIAGNLILNLNILLIILTGFFFYGKKIFQIKLYVLDKIIISFFIFVFFSGIINFIDLNYLKDENYALAENFSFSVLIKSVSYIRYLILYFVLRYLIENELINFKFFFTSCLVFSLFVSLDIFYQFIFEKDIFGFEATSARKFSGPFGNEFIAGGYLQRFAIFSFFLFSIFFKINKKLYLSLIIAILFLIYLIALVLSGNRMPLILFVFMTFLIFVFEKNIRKYLIFYLAITVIICVALVNSNNLIKSNFSNFVTQIQSISKIITTNEINQSGMNSYFHEFKTFYGTWLMNRYIGGGVKSFRINCWQRENINVGERTTCNTHPHNYYLEILADLGLVGFFILVVVFSTILYISFFKKYFRSLSRPSDNILTPFMFLFFIEIFPIKSTGSFFTTSNATFLFLVLAITVALSRKLDLNRN